MPSDLTLRSLDAVVRDLRKDHGMLAERVDKIEQFPKRAVQLLGGLIIAAAALTNVLTYISNEQAAQKLNHVDQSATVAASKSTETSSAVKSLVASQTNATAAREDGN